MTAVVDDDIVVFQNNGRRIVVTVWNHLPNRRLFGMHVIFVF